MIWAAWRSERLLVLVSFGVIAAFAVWLVVTGSIQQTAWTAYASHHCLDPGASERCAVLADNYYGASHFSSVNVGLAIAIPPVLGLVLGAPVVAREIEQRTNRLAWTQSVTRTRWLIVKLCVGALACCVLVGALVPVLEWWTGAVQRGNRIMPSNFDVSGFAPVAYVLFAFMLGATLGALIRRTGWAFAAGVAIYGAGRLIIREYVRPRLVSPSTVTVNPDGVYVVNGWTLQSGYLPLGRSSPAAGQTWQSGSELIANCTRTLKEFSQSGTDHCITQNKLHFVVQYQPESHFWALQGAESAIFVGASLVLLAITALAVQRWRT